MKNRPVIIIILITILTSYFTYYFLQRQVFIKTRSMGETEFHTEINNPFSKIFLGRMATGETSYTQYQVSDRITMLADTASFVLLLAAVFQYFRSRTRKYTFLLFMLVTEMYVVVGSISTRLFYWIYHLTAPESQLLSPNTVSIAWGIRYALLLGALSTLIVLLLNPANKEVSENRQVRIQFKWMRPFHYLADRLIIVLLVSNGFVFYFLNGGAAELERDQLYLWSVLSITGCVIIATFVTESLFQLSPSKILTGSLTVSDNFEKPSTGSILVRSLARIIPFNSLAFVVKKGWHDSLSKTTVVYAAEESWLARQSKLVGAIFAFGIVVLVILLITTVMMTSDPFHFSATFALPYALTPIVLLAMATVLTCWLASLSNFGDNLYNKETSESGIHFWTALAIWIPIVNFRITSVLLNDIAHNLGSALTNDEKKRSLEYLTSRCRISFVLLNIVIVLAALLWLRVTYRVEFMVVIGLLTLALINWSYTIIRYAKCIRTISEEVSQAYMAKAEVSTTA
ncbi:MAG TPA: hypothetical protein VGD65_03170 [Chryseosolibacter sp.]